MEQEKQSMGHNKFIPSCLLQLLRQYQCVLAKRKQAENRNCRCAPGTAVSVEHRATREIKGAFLLDSRVRDLFSLAILMFHDVRRHTTPRLCASSEGNPDRFPERLSSHMRAGKPPSRPDHPSSTGLITSTWYEWFSTSMQSIAELAKDQFLESSAGQQFSLSVRFELQPSLEEMNTSETLAILLSWNFKARDNFTDHKHEWEERREKLRDGKSKD